MEKIFMLVDIARSCKSYCKKPSKSFNNSRRLCSTFGRLYKRLFSWCLQCGVTYLQHYFVNLQVNRDRGWSRYNLHTITWFVFCLIFWGTLQGRWETWRCGRKCFQIPFQNLRIRQLVIGDWHSRVESLCHAFGSLSERFCVELMERVVLCWVVQGVNGFLWLEGNWHGCCKWTCFEETQKSSTHCKNITKAFMCCWYEPELSVVEHVHICDTVFASLIDAALASEPKSNNSEQNVGDWNLDWSELWSRICWRGWHWTQPWKWGSVWTWAVWHRRCRTSPLRRATRKRVPVPLTDSWTRSGGLSGSCKWDKRNSWSKLWKHSTTSPTMSSEGEELSFRRARAWRKWTRYLDPPTISLQLTTLRLIFLVADLFMFVHVFDFSRPDRAVRPC